MPSHVFACITSSYYRWLRDLTFPRVSRSDKTFCFSVRSCRMRHDVQCTLLHSPLHVNTACACHVLSSQYGTRESEIEQVPIYTSRRKKLKRKEFINHKTATEKMVISLRSDSESTEKNTFRTWKTTEMFKYIFVMTVMVFYYMFCTTWIWFVFLSETWFRLCIFTWNMISCFFLWTWSCLSNFS